MGSSSEDLLDKPEIFLLGLSRIPAFEERIFCLLYQKKFQEAIASVDHRLNKVKALCDILTTSTKIRNILRVILACGNCMNASQPLRCEADGFDLAILPNLKEVKSKDPSKSLIHYIAAVYINKLDYDLVELPLPDSSDFLFVARVKFEDIAGELRQMRNELNGVEEQVASVLKLEGGDNVYGPFKKKMQEFLKSSNEEWKKQEGHLITCRQGFKKMTEMFGVKAKSGETEVTTEYFFTLWAEFSEDFKHVWKTEAKK